MDLLLHGRRALVTGGGRGIGRAIAASLLGEGADVAIVGRDRAALEDAAQSLGERSEGRILCLAADTGSDESVAAMAAAIEREFGGVDILVNNAATPSAWPGVTEDDLEREVNVKVRGYLRCVRALTPHMVEHGWGRVINIGGIAFRHSTSLVGSLRNAAVVAMSKALADELGPDGVNVTVLHPGLTTTATTRAYIDDLARVEGRPAAEVERELGAAVSIGRLVSPEEVAAVATFLASPLSAALAGDGVFATGGTSGSTHY